jgi:ribosomal protein S20
MKRIPCQLTISTVLIVLSFLIAFSALSEEAKKDIGQHVYKEITQSNNNTIALSEARINLKIAFDSYRKGDIAATEKNLKAASEWLDKAAQNSKTEKAREEARKLAAEINEFKGNIQQDSEQHEHGLARFWHRTTSIIKREYDHLVHSYLELSHTETLLKHLLDAKLHLFTAEHDLLVSHNAVDAKDELSMVLDYLDEAVAVAKPTSRDSIIALSKDIRLLHETINTEKKIWKNDSVTHALDKVLVDLAGANENASPTVQHRIELLVSDILTLRADVERDNIRNDYEAAMAALQNIINGL